MIDPSGLLSIPFVGWVDVGEQAGEEATQYWANMSIDQSIPWYQRGLANVAGSIAALWTENTSDKTFMTLSAALAANSALKAAGAGAGTGQSFKPNLQFFASQDRGMIEKAAKTLKMSKDQRWDYGDFIEAYKRANGIPNNGTLSWKKLIELGKDFLGK